MFQRYCGMTLLTTAVLAFSMTLVLSGCSKSAEEVESTDTVKDGGSGSGSVGTSQTSNPGGAGLADDDEAEARGNVGGVTAPATATGSSADGRSFTLPGLIFDKPAAWTNEMPSNSMRVAQFNVPAPVPAEGGGAEGPAGPATQLAITYGGARGFGPHAGNFDRWANQLAQPDGSASRDQAIISEKEVGGMSVYLFEVSGTQVAETTPGSGIRVNNPDFILLAAIVETSVGPYYFKLVGPLTTIEPFRADFAAMVDSFRRP